MPTSQRRTISVVGNLTFVHERYTGIREFVELRYYVGQVSQAYGDPRLYAEQRSFLDKLRDQDARFSVHLGRLEPRPGVGV